MMNREDFKKTTKYLNEKYGDSSGAGPVIFNQFGRPYERLDSPIDDVRSDGQFIDSSIRLKRAKDLASGENWSRLPFNECEGFFANNAIAGKVVNLIVDYGLLNGWRFSFKNKSREKTLKFENEIKTKIDKPLSIEKEVINAIIWSRIYGSAYLVGNYVDGRFPNEPLDVNNIKQIRWIRALTPFEIFPQRWNYKFDKNYLEPDRYLFTGYGGVIEELSGVEIHPSRIIRFNGRLLPRQLYISNGFIHNSVLQPVYDVFQDYGLALEACGYSIAEFSQGIYKLKGLASMVGAGKEGAIIARMQTVDTVRNLHRTIIMDADNEDYTRVAGRFAGMGEIVEKLEKQMVAVSGIPHNLLFSEAAGHAKAFSSNSGNSEWGEWETTVHSWRKKYLTKNLHRLYSLLFLNKENQLTRGKLEDFSIEYSGQRKFSEEKEAQLYAEITATDRNLIDAGVLLPSEIRATRYAPGGTFSDYSIRVELDNAAYKKVESERETQQKAFEKKSADPASEDPDGGEEDYEPEKTIKKNGVTFKLRS